MPDPSIALTFNVSRSNTQVFLSTSALASHLPSVEMTMLATSAGLLAEEMISGCSSSSDSSFIFDSESES